MKENKFLINGLFQRIMDNNHIMDDLSPTASTELLDLITKSIDNVAETANEGFEIIGSALVEEMDHTFSFENRTGLTQLQQIRKRLDEEIKIQELGEYEAKQLKGFVKEFFRIRRL